MRPSSTTAHADEGPLHEALFYCAVKQVGSAGRYSGICLINKHAQLLDVQIHVMHPGPFSRGCHSSPTPTFIDQRLQFIFNIGYRDHIVNVSP